MGRSFDSNSPLKMSESSSFQLEPMASFQPEVIELHDGKDEVTIGMLYNDLEPSTPADDTDDHEIYNHHLFSTKRSWDEMRARDLSEERSRIIEELKTELDRSRASHTSSIDENFPYLIVSLEETPEENLAKRVRNSNSVDIKDESEIVVSGLIEECLYMVTSSSDLEEYKDACTLAWSDDNFYYECSSYPQQNRGNQEFNTKKHFISDKHISETRKTDLDSFKNGRNLKLRHAIKRTRGIVHRYLSSRRCFGRSL